MLEISKTPTLLSKKHRVGFKWCQNRERKSSIIILELSNDVHEISGKTQVYESH